MVKNNIISFNKKSSNHNGNSLQSRRLNPERLKDARLAMSYNQSELAAAIGKSRQAISAFEQGEKSPDANTMKDISAILKQPLSYFVAEDLPVFGSYSVRFYRASGPSTKKKNLMADTFSKWFVQTACYFDKYVNYPSLELPAVSPENDFYSQEEIEQAAESCRELWGLGWGPISNVISLLESKGITTCFLEMPEAKIEAFSYWNGNRAFIFLASEKDSAVRRRFDAAHELGHLILHRWLGLEEIEDPKKLKIRESEANRFAAAFLLPRKSFPNEIYTTRLDAFVELKPRWKVSIQAMVYRCKVLKIFDEDQITNLYKQISARRWKKKEPLDDKLPLEEPKMLKKAITLLLESKRKIVDEIRLDINLNPRIIEKICGLPVNFLTSKNTEEFNPTLK